MIRYIENTMPRSENVPEIPEIDTKQAREFHKSVPGYCVTPFVNAKKLAEGIRLGGLYIKDESKRYGLNAFKVLGAAYAMARYIAKKSGDAKGKPCFDSLRQGCAEKTTFYAATDGNHGRAVAWTAKMLGQPAEIYLPGGSSKERLENIRALGAYAEITDMNYDDTVRYVAARAEKTGGVIIQDTAWEGYYDIPYDIMTGYSVIADEIFEAGILPTHIFLQAGVGSFAGGIIGSVYEYCKNSGKRLPKIIITEPDKADCYYRSAKSCDGRPHFVTGELDTLMAGLACGEPNPTAFEIIKRGAAGFLSVDDKIAADGMRILAANGIVSGESGAVTCGALVNIMLYYPDIKDRIGLCDNSSVLLISTEGDTDRNMYRDVVWFGRNSL